MRVLEKHVLNGTVYGFKLGVPAISISSAAFGKPS
jgi:hypothetical protein